MLPIMITMIILPLVVQYWHWAPATSRVQLNPLHLTHPIEQQHLQLQGLAKGKGQQSSLAGLVVPFSAFCIL